jgi:putative ABC transport system ATP-binding protein
MKENLIEVADLKFGPNQIFKIPRFELKKGERVLLMGPSGCGKTSFLEFLAGFRKGQAKKVHVDPKHRVVFQDLNLIEDFSVLENLRLELPQKDVETALGWLKRLDFSASTNTLVKRLSKGEQQRVAVVRALAKNDELLLADEPTSHLDRARADILMQLLHERAHSALVVSHDDHLKRFFDRTVLFEELTQ